MARKKTHKAKPAKTQHSNVNDDSDRLDAYGRMMNGDDSEMQLNYDGVPTHGTLWNAAFEHAAILREKRQGKSTRANVRSLFPILGWVRANSKLSAYRSLKSPRCVSWVKQCPPFTNEHIERFKREIDECGRTVLLAYVNDDVAFFDELARLVNIELGSRRKKDKTNEEEIIESAIQLWHDFNGNPTRERVKFAVEKAGLVIRPKDWPSYFKRCKLDFLKSYKGAGRPPKPEPLKRFVIEMPKGKFTVHTVTKSEGLRLELEAEETNRLMDEAEKNGEEYIPF